VELHDGDVVHLGEVAATFGSSGGRTVARTERLKPKDPEV
jgi:hypothetical protein